MSAEVDTIIHQQAAAMVEGLTKSALPDPTGDMQSSGVSDLSAYILCTRKFNGGQPDLASRKSALRR